jgi:hypothetical protein
MPRKKPTEQPTERQEMEAYMLEQVGVLCDKAPHELTPEDVDEGIREAVVKINRSAWVWTLSCCAGHEKRAGEPAEQQPPEPLSPDRTYVELAVQRRDYGRMLALFSDSLLSTANLSEDGLEYPALTFRALPYRYWSSGEIHPAWRAISLSIEWKDPEEHAMALLAVSRFADLVVAAGAAEGRSNPVTELYDIIEVMPAWRKQANKELRARLRSDRAERVAANKAKKQQAPKQASE